MSFSGVCPLYTHEKHCKCSTNSQYKAQSDLKFVVLFQYQTSRTYQSGHEKTCNKKPEVPCAGMEVNHKKKTVHRTATHRMDADLGEVIHYGGCYYAEKICGHQLKRKEVTIHASEEVKGYKCRQHDYNVRCVSLLAIANFQIIDSFIQNEVINCQNGQKKCQNEEKKNQFKIHPQRKSKYGYRR